MNKKCPAGNKKLKVVNIGLQSFADSLRRQGVKVTQVAWRPPVKHDKDMTDLLDSLM